MVVSKAHQRASNKYNAAHYDRIALSLPLGYRDRLKAAAAAADLSVNGYIKAAIDEKMQAEQNDIK